MPCAVLETLNMCLAIATLPEWSFLHRIDEGHVSSSLRRPRMKSPVAASRGAPGHSGFVQFGSFVGGVE